MFNPENETDLKKAAEILKNGGIIAIPTETVYGLAANALNETAVMKIFKAKNRPADNPLIVHIADISELEKYSYPTREAYLLAEKFWPGPLSIVLKKKNNIPAIVSAGLDSVAIRMPSHEVARKLISMSGVPLAAPSANISGKPSPTAAEHVIEDFGNTIDGVVDGGSCKYGVESTVISLVGETPLLLRPGFITFEQLKIVLPNIKLSKAVVNSLNENESAPSPGMKHKHYAPKAEAICVVGEPYNVAEYIKEQSFPAKTTAVMCLSGDEEFFDGYKVISYGEHGSSEKQAEKLFFVLREIDEPEIRKIIINIEILNGVGLAVYNRLLRACNFNVVELL